MPESNQYCNCYFIDIKSISCPIHRHERIHADGRKAFTTGVSDFDNPYKDPLYFTHADRKAWASGWAEAQVEEATQAQNIENHR